MRKRPRARDFGFVGKSCIHPSQVAWPTISFVRLEAEIAHAVNIVASIKSSPASGAGAIVIDGKMIDVPYVTRAQAIVAQAEALGLLPNAASHPSIVSWRFIVFNAVRSSRSILDALPKRSGSAGPLSVLVLISAPISPDLMVCTLLADQR